jgi:hypothetical protein
MDILFDYIAQWDKDWADRFPKRVTRKDKERFLDQLEQELQARSFETTRPAVRYLLQSRLLLTTCENPKVIFTAHYDTPTIMPIWVSVFMTLIGHTRQILGSFLFMLIIYVPIFLISIFAPENTAISAVVSAVFLLLILSMLTLFVPNPHNREDNTSGVIGLMALAEWLKDKPELRRQVQLIFFDNEELGLLGSSGLKRQWDKKKYPYREAAVINLDCISRGRIPLIVHHGNDRVANQLMPYLTRHLPQTINFHLRFLPLSDNFTFRKIGAVDISYAEPAVLPGGYYIPRVHRPNDNDFSAERAALLIHALTEYLANYPI